METNQRKTVAAIAAECSVSAMTVSRALRNDAKVREETRRQIVAAAERLGYIRAPRMGRPGHFEPGKRGKVELIAGTVGRSMAIFHSQLIVSIEQRLAKAGVECVIRTCSGNYEQFITLLENLRSSGAGTAMLVGSFIPEQLAALLDAVPDAVLLDNPGISPSKTSTFSFDNVQAARLAVGHLTGCGRKRILLLSGVADHFFSRDIEQGYRNAVAASGLPFDPELVLHADFTADSAHDVLGGAIDSGLNFDAVFTNDEMAAGVFRALLERGKKIPQDVAVCGCDGLPVGMQLFPRLTTVALDYEELGSMAVEYVLDSERDRKNPLRIQLLPRLETRESSC